LKDIDNGMEQVKKVRLEVRKAFYQHEVRPEENWPLASVQPTPFYLCATTGTLRTERVDTEGKVQYLSTGRRDGAAFSYRFEHAAELVGGMRLRLWVSTSEGDDLDLFVVIRKLDSRRNEVFFSGFNGYERDAVAKGWLRASHRELDRSRSTPLRPWHKHTHIQKFRSGEIVPVEIEIWPSATLFEPGSTLQVTVQGHDAAKYPAFGHGKLINRGMHTIFTGGQYDSSLTVPLNTSTSIVVEI
jgi:predicted acyl esterase